MALVWIVGAALVFCVAVRVISLLNTSSSLEYILVPLAISLFFGGVVWSLRAATIGGVFLGVLVCFLLLVAPSGQHSLSSPGRYSALASLIAVFVTSFVATRFGRSRKESTGLAESRRGRQASQIVANLGAAALFVGMGYYAACIAALSEAAADTASSEIGQALGGPVRLLTSWRKVPSGTDGGISLRGTLAGVTSAAIVVAVGSVLHLTWRVAAITFFSAVAGLLFDSLLGATAERKGWVGNDLVNFSSTVFAALLALTLT